MEIPQGIEEILNRQFKIIGYPELTFKDISEEGTVEVKGKVKNWFEVYQFKSHDQYLNWREEAQPIIEKKGYKFDQVDSLYGFTYSYKKEEIKKEGQLTLL